MRVLHVLPSISYKLGGPTEAALNFVRYLRELGVNAEIATTNDDLDGLLKVPLRKRTVYEGIPVWFFPRLARVKTYMPSLSLTHWLYYHIKEYDLIHNHYLFCYATTVASVIAQSYGKPYVSRTIGQLTPWALSQSALKKKVYSSLIERPILNQASAIHCTADLEAIDVENFGVRSSKFILPLGVNAPEVIPDASARLRQRYNLPKDALVLLFLSRLNEKKRPDFLLEAFANLDHQTQDLRILVAGTGEQSYCSYLKDKAAALKIADKVTLTGFVTGFDKNLLLQGADVFALPSYSENFGIAVVEALAAGLPVMITPDVQIAPDIKGANAGLVVPANLDDWGNALSTLLKSPTMMETLSNNGRQLVRDKYGWPTITSQLIQVYQDILSQKKSQQLSL